jgi:ribosome maturation protein SDO1
MEEARLHIDPFKSVEAQVPAVMDAIRPLIPIRFDKVRIAVRVSGESYGRCYEDFKHFGKITKEEWQKDGSWIGIVEMPAGMQNDFLEKISNKTHGEAETKILKGAS